MGHDAKGPELWRRRLLENVFTCDPFVVAVGTKPLWKRREEAAAAKEEANNKKDLKLKGGGMPATVLPGPAAAGPAVVELLACVIKEICGGVASLLTSGRAEFIAHFNGLTWLNDDDIPVSMGEVAAAAFDTAKARDVSGEELRAAGLHEWGYVEVRSGVLAQVRGRVMTEDMPNGEFDVDVVCTTTLLTRDPWVLGGTLEWDTYTMSPVVDRKPRLVAHMVDDIRDALGRTYSVNAGKRWKRFIPDLTTAKGALLSAARARTWNPVQEWFELLPAWDGVERFGEFASLLNIKDGEAGGRELSIDMLRKFFIGTVARSFDPGCKMDTMLVLHGGQGVDKSRLFQAMAPAGRFSSTQFDIENKDSYMVLYRCSLYEFAELSAFGKKEVNAIKAFISNPVDDFRPPYEPSVTNVPRHTTLCGSVNDLHAWLRDQTGSRRFWVIPLNDGATMPDARFEEIVQLLPRLWAEALSTYRGAPTCADCAKEGQTVRRCVKHRWWLTKEMEARRAARNEAYTERDPIVECIEALLVEGIEVKQGSRGFSGMSKARPYRVSDVCALLPGSLAQTTDLSVNRRINAAFATLGWEKRRVGQLWHWVYPPVYDRLKAVPSGGGGGVGKSGKEEDDVSEKTQSVASE